MDRLTRLVSDLLCFISILWCGYDRNKDIHSSFLQDNLLHCSIPEWIYGIGALVIAWLVANELVFAFQCTPVRKAWEIEVPGHCTNPLATVRVIHIFNVLLDVVILALPRSAVLHLYLSTARKFGVVAVFLLGGL